MKKIAVIGLGTAGIQSLAHFLSWSDMQVFSIHDPNIDIVGIGESTNPSFINALSYGLNFNPSTDMVQLDATFKFGTKYSRWRKNDFINPLLGPGYAIHMNTFKLKDFAIPKFRKIWGEKFKEIHGNVSSIKNNSDNVIVEVNNKQYQFDFVIVCTGFPKNKKDYFEPEDMPVNHCLVHNISKNENPLDSQYTDHIAMKSGWMFRVPLTSRSSYGYLFNDKISDVSEIRKEMCEFLAIKENDHQNIEYKFNPFYAKNIIDKRIFKNGNAALFFEPMFANSLWAYDNINRIIFDYIYGIENEQTGNEKFIELAKKIENMIRFHYLGGSTFDTIFWKNSSEKSKKHIEQYQFFHEMNEYMKLVNEKNFIVDKNNWCFSEKALNTINENLEYNYFK